MTTRSLPRSFSSSRDRRATIERAHFADGGHFSTHFLRAQHALGEQHGHLLIAIEGERRRGTTVSADLLRLV